jgi:hypothetical protein
MLKQGSYPHASSPHHTFFATETALHLNYYPNYSQMKIKAIAAKFKLPDLHVILSSYLAMYAPGHCHVSGPASNLPFDTLEVWEKLQVQNQAYHTPMIFFQLKQLMHHHHQWHGHVVRQILFWST